MMLDVGDRFVVIVGGGGVATRKAQGLLDAGATRVRVIAPEIASEMPANVDRVVEQFRPEHLDGASLVFAATDDADVNAAVVREARARGILVNRADADESDPGDFATPALWRSGSVTLTVATSGNPALAAKIRDELSAKLETKYLLLAEAMQTLRPALMRVRGLADWQRREMFRRLVSPPALAVLSDEGERGLRRWLVREYPTELRGSEIADG